MGGGWKGGWGDRVGSERFPCFKPRAPVKKPADGSFTNV